MKYILAVILASALTLGCIFPALAGSSYQITEIQPNHLYFVGRREFISALQELATKGRIDTLEPVYSKDYSGTAPRNLMGIFVFISQHDSQPGSLKTQPQKTSVQ